MSCCFLTTLSAVIFDFDDTLVDTRTSRVPALIKAASDFGIVVSDKDILSHWGKPFRSLIRNAVPGIDYDTFCLHYSKVMRRFEPTALPGALKLIRRLDQLHIPVFVVSSGSRPLIRQDLKHAHLWEYISKLWGFEDTVYHKPNPRVLEPTLRVLRRRAMDQKKVLYVGDSLADYRIASANRIAFCAVLSGNTSRAEFRSAGLRNGCILDSLQSLLDSKNRLGRFFQSLAIVRPRGVVH